MRWVWLKRRWCEISIIKEKRMRNESSKREEDEK